MTQTNGYRGIWYYNQPSNDEYVYKYSGGLGTYCAKHLPMACYAPAVNKTFFCYGGTNEAGVNLQTTLSFYDHQTGTVPKPTILLEQDTTDAHNNPVIMIDKTGYIWIFISSHGHDRPAFIYKTTTPYDINHFELIADFNFSYPQPWPLENGQILFLHTIYEEKPERKRFLYWRTYDAVNGWSSAKVLAAIERGHYQVSCKSGNKVRTAFNFHPAICGCGNGLNSRTNLYYLETDDGGTTWKTINGKQQTLPLREVTNDALVFSFRQDKRLVYLKDMNFDSEGNPVILVVTSNGYESGPSNGQRLWQTAYWDKKSWKIDGSIISDSNYDTGCLHIDKCGTWRIIGPTEKGPQQFNPGGEMAVWTSADYGCTWEKERQITQDSKYNHSYARRPVNAHEDFYAFWADGHGRKRSTSRLYFCDKNGLKVRRFPLVMTKNHEKPEMLS